MIQRKYFIHSRFIHSLKKNNMGMDRWGLNIPHHPSVPALSGTYGNVWECMGMDGIIQTGWNIIREHLRAKINSLVKGSLSPSKWVFQRQGMQNAEINHA